MYPPRVLSLPIIIEVVPKIKWGERIEKVSMHLRAKKN
jgi:hypothetical protein